MPQISSILVWIILGGFSGWIASKIMKRDAQMGIGLNIIVGIIGAFVGGWVFSLVGWGPATGLNLWSFFVAIVGAVLFLGIVGLFTKRH